MDAERLHSRKRVRHAYARCLPASICHFTKSGACFFRSGTYVVPRSHTLRLEGRGGCDSWSEEERTSIPPQAVPAIGQAGDVLIFHCALDHSAGPNESDGVRSFVQVRYGAR